VYIERQRHTKQIFLISYAGGISVSAIFSSTVILYIRGIIKRHCRNNVIPLPNVPGKDYMETLV
jgi:hypothetical protein